MDRSESIPRFSNEAEEAKWWYEQRDRLTAQAETALTRGELKLRRLDPLSAQTTAPARNITIRVAEQDLSRARDLVAKRGLRYQTYLKMLLHEALDNEERRQTQRP
jgi:predicted DNA binding CopG/RHH family protein